MSPKLKLPDHVKRLYEKDASDAAKKRHELRQMVAEDTAQALVRDKKQTEAKQKADLAKYNAGRVADGIKEMKEINMLQDEGYPYSDHLAKNRIANRIAVLELDKKHYAKEVKKLKSRESDTGEKYALTSELANTLDSIETELAEIKIDMSIDSEEHENS